MLDDTIELLPEDYRIIRRHAFKFCYQQEINQEHSFTPAVLEQFMEHFQVEKRHKEFLISLITCVFQHLPECDALIQKYAQNWKLYRIAKVDLSIMRVAITEFLERESTSSAIIISDALDIGQEYGSEKSTAFLNGILDAVVNEVRKDRAKSV